MKQHTVELLTHTGAANFAYDHTTGEFLQGSQRYAPEELPLASESEPADTSPLQTNLSELTLVRSFGHTVMLPSMYDWLNANLTESIVDETVDVMRDVFVRLRPDMASFNLSRDHGGFMGFNVGRIRNEHPHLVLTTIGNCACLGVDPDGIFGDREWPEKVAEFSFHNIDTPPQAISLLAGLGHLAFQAAESK